MAFIEKESKDLGAYTTPRRFTASARAAMTHILQARKEADPRGILLPAYIGLSHVEGSGVFDPIRQTGIDYDFYKVSDRLAPDLADLEARLRTKRYQLAFLIHYFGCPQVDPQAFVRLCHAHGVRVIEDCAHTLLGGLEGMKLGTYGDYAIFSIHKSCTTPDGGFYLDHRGDLPTTLGNEAWRIPLATLEAFANTDLAATCVQRRLNYQTVSAWVRRLPGLELFFGGVPAGAVPLNCPVMVEGGRRAQLYFRLVQDGVMPTALYHRLITQINRSDYPHSHHVADNILNLPTHPDIANADLARYKAILERSVKEVFAS